MFSFENVIEIFNQSFIEKIFKTRRILSCALIVQSSLHNNPKGKCENYPTAKLMWLQLRIAFVAKTT